MEEEVVAEDASFSREADAEEVNNGSYRSEDEPDEEGQENEEENVMEEEQEPPIIEPQDMEIPTTKRESVAKLKELWEQHSGRESQINTSTNMTSKISSITDETSCEESTSFSISEKRVTSLSIDNSEVHRMRELNERLYKTITFLTNQNNSLRVEVASLTRKAKEISSISWKEEKTNRAEEIEALEEKNESLNQMLTDLQDRLKKEINIRTEAENKLWTLERMKKELNLEIKKLKKNIKNKEKMVSQLKEINKTEKEQTSNTVDIISNGGINADIVDGIGIDMAELRKSIFKNAEKTFTDIERKYKTKVEELEKTVTEKEAELTKARKENSEHARLIEDYKLQISSLNERLVKAEKLHSEEISHLNKEIQKSKEEINAIKQKTEFRSQTIEETIKVALDTELNIYKTYLDRLEGRIKSHETEKSTGGGYVVSEKSTETTEKTKTKTKIVQADSRQEIHHSQETETSVSQHEEAENQETKDSDGDDDSDEDNSDDGQNSETTEDDQPKSDLKGENEEDDQGLSGSLGTVVHNQGWNGTKDWSEHFEPRQTLQNPDPTSEDQPKSDPETDNEEDNQGPKDSDEDDDSGDGQLD